MADLAALEAAISARLVESTPIDERAWVIAERASVGRYLVAAHDLSADEVVFKEMPIVVATPEIDGERVMRSEMVAVAIELLRESPESHAQLLAEADFAADIDGACASSLHTWTVRVLSALAARPPIFRSDGAEVALTEDAVGWALSVASVNVHGRSNPDRGVLGLLASMMEHDCDPSACTDIGSAAEGSVVSLRTKRAVKAGESLSIAYVAVDAPVDFRRRQLRLQHGFVCECARCVSELAAGGDDGAWKQAWEDRIWCGDAVYAENDIS